MDNEIFAEDYALPKQKNDKYYRNLEENAAEMNEDDLEFSRIMLRLTLQGDKEIGTKS